MTLGQYTLASAQAALQEMLHLVDADLERLSNGQSQLSALQRVVIGYIRVRQAALVFGEQANISY